MTPRWWAEPTAGDIVWCHIRDEIHSRPKPRPAPTLAVFDDDAPLFTVRLASQRTTTLQRGEFGESEPSSAFAHLLVLEADLDGLRNETKFWRALSDSNTQPTDQKLLSSGLLDSSWGCR